jgi:hypothetical protein
MDPFVLMTVAVLLGMPAGFYAMKNPRTKGERLGSTRIALMTLSFVGLLIFIAALALRMSQ